MRLPAIQPNRRGPVACAALFGAATLTALVLAAVAASKGKVADLSPGTWVVIAAPCGIATATGACWAKFRAGRGEASQSQEPQDVAVNNEYQPKPLPESELNPPQIPAGNWEEVDKVWRDDLRRLLKPTGLDTRIQSHSSPAIIRGMIEIRLQWQQFAPHTKVMQEAMLYIDRLPKPAMSEAGGQAASTPQGAASVAAEVAQAAPINDSDSYAQRLDRANRSLAAHSTGSERVQARKQLVDLIMGIVKEKDRLALEWRQMGSLPANVRHLDAESMAILVPVEAPATHPGRQLEQLCRMQTALKQEHARTLFQDAACRLALSS